MTLHRITVAALQVGDQLAVNGRIVESVHALSRGGAFEIKTRDEHLPNAFPAYHVWRGEMRVGVFRAS